MSEPDYKACIEVAIVLIEEQRESAFVSSSLSDGSIPSTDDRTYIETLDTWLGRARQLVGP